MPPSPPPHAGEPVVVEDELPAPLGSASFRVKGHVYSKMKDRFDRTVDGGTRRVLERVGRDDVTAFLGQRFFATSWYDALPLGPLAMAHARLLGTPFHAHAREHGRVIAREDVPGIYKAVLRMFSPETVVGRLPRAATLYFDFGVTTADPVSAGRARIAVGGLPCSLAPLLAGVVEGFVGVSLELSGARGVVVRTTEVAYDGKLVDRIPTAVIRHEATWT